MSQYMRNQRAATRRQARSKHNVRPLEQSQKTALLPIESIAYGGDGVTHWDGKAVFVPMAVTGDKAQVELEKNHGRFLRGKLVKLIEPSPHRFPPPCRYFGICGGCQLQHVSPDYQAVTKKQFVVDALSRIGHCDNVVVMDTIRAPEMLRYRNTGEFVFGWRQGRALSGFFSANSHNIVDIDDCLVQSPLNQQLYDTIRDLVLSGDISVFNPRSGRGSLRWLETRSNAQQTEAVVTLVTTSQHVDINPIIDRLRERVPQIRGVIQRIGKSSSRVLWGEQWIHESIEIPSGRKLRFRVSADTFWQINGFLVPALVSTVRDLSGLTGKETVADLFAGAGLFSCGLSDLAASIHAIEWSRSASADAKHNLRSASVKNFRIWEGNVADILEEWHRSEISVDMVILDPSRQGASGCVPGIVRLGAKTILYVSCDPTTLARDIALFRQGGYEADVAQPIDLFPHTYHVETVARLRKID